ncbi:(2Fe-2S)-binding protein [Piscinibacter sp. HJYY11]|uniref:(2Fe-2S)-binding protein n=1 Tax=Piscinibacter sp. HJYY11 TaxID=2801333 RepID=UPI00191CFD34|nr:(2Fe-2S)-binding protein [Piscinibacter sp. HJYY11]MBL0727733.1 (2Fe-2S)-binding protein [Piscinibacter sp. HJYY11]
MQVKLNRQTQPLDEDQAQTPLLWWLRDARGLTGTRYGCGQGVCGACTVHLDGQAVRSCITPCSAAEGRELTTIEGLARGDVLHPVQQAWLELAVAQCGYCQSGQVMGAAALLAATPNPTDEQINAAMAGHLCRCGTYDRIRAAIHRAAQIVREGGAR